MANDFTFRGISSTAMNAVVQEYPPDTRAEERQEAKPIPGRHGKLHLAESTDGSPVYDTVTLTMKLNLLPEANLNAVRAWLSGSGYLILGNDTAYRREARVIKSFSAEKVIRGREYRTASVSFECQPLKEMSNPPTLAVSNGASVQNNGTVPARPLITVTGSGSITITVAGEVMTLDGLSGTIAIDSLNRVAYNPTTMVLMTGIVSGEWPVLAVGANTVTWTGSVTAVTVQPNMRWV